MKKTSTTAMSYHIGDGDQMLVCRGCGAIETEIGPLMQCSCRLKVRYCGKECQAAGMERVGVAV